jgi:hypothetical protein
MKQRHAIWPAPLFLAAGSVTAAFLMRCVGCLRAEGADRLVGTIGKLAMLLFMSHACLMEPALALPVGSFTFNFPGTAEGPFVGTKFRVTMVSDEVLGSGLRFAIDFEMDITGSDKNQATQRLRDQFRDRGISFDSVGTNSTDVTGITGKNPNDPNQTVTAPIKKIDGGAPLILDGTDIEIQRGVKPGDKWKASLEPGLGTVTGGALAIDIPGVGPLSTFLNPGSTPETAGLALYNLLFTNGFPDVELQGTEVSFLLSPSHELISRVAAFSFEGTDLHYGLEIPAAIAAIPEPSTLRLFGVGVLGVLGYYCWLRLHHSRP